MIIIYRSINIYLFKNSKDSLQPVNFVARLSCSVGSTRIYQWPRMGVFSGKYLKLDHLVIIIPMMEPLLKVRLNKMFNTLLLCQILDSFWFIFWFTVSYKGFHEDREFTSGEHVKFILGEGSDAGICRGVEEGLLKVPEGETCVLMLKPKYGYNEQESELLGIPPNAELTFEVTLHHFTKVIIFIVLHWLGERL